MRKTCKERGCDALAAPKQSRCYPHRNERRRSKVRDHGDMRILHIDIETRPTVAYTWSLWNANIGIDQIIEPGRTICFAAKWHGEDEVLFYSEWNDGAEAMVEAAWQLLNEADVVVHYYGSRFDIPHLNAEFLKHGYTPPSAFKQIDLKLAVSKRFRFPSSKLQFVSEVLGLEGKEEHEGFKLWKKVIDGDRDAQGRMESYNKRDVTLLEEVYEVLLPWIPNHPSRHLYNGSGLCPTCGADEVRRDGYYLTQVSKFERYVCDACKSPFRSGRRVEGVDLRPVAL